MGKKNKRFGKKKSVKKGQDTGSAQSASSPEFLAVVSAEDKTTALAAFVEKAKADVVKTVTHLAGVLASGSADEQFAALLCVKETVLVNKTFAALALAETLPQVFALAAHKKRKNIREAAEGLANTFADAKVVSSVLFASAAPTLCLAAMDKSSKWQSKVLALKLILKIASGDIESKQIVSKQMITIVPVVSELMWSTKNAVKDAAEETMTQLCDTIGNQDLTPFVPILVNSISHPEEVVETIFKLASTTFVQTVTAAALSIMVPLLSRGFNEVKISVKRKSAVVTENLAKLVRNPVDAETFLPVLAPALKKAKTEVADEECRNRCGAALASLDKLAAKIESSKRVTLAGKEKETDAAVTATLKIKGAPKGFLSSTAVAVRVLVDCEKFDKDIWTSAFGECFDEAKLLEAVVAASGAVIEDEDDDAATKSGDGELLCDCKFSLAYGSNILLNSARLTLQRGKRYGVIASKSAGKTTLLRAIANYQIDGFPSADELRTIFVETDISDEQSSMNVVEFVIDTIKHIRKMEQAEVKTILTEMGFNDRMQSGPIKSLSGGWKMKLALVRGMLCKTDIYLMDEPTNHLDVVNVQWVVDYLTGPLCKNVTSLIVSHDSKFLDKVCTHVVHFDDLKLKTYSGNLSKFVEKKPEVKSYFDLGSTKLKFSFPVPRMIAGVKNRSKKLMQLDKVYFKYPGADKYQINDVSVIASMASRVAIVGANGAGKSTMIKVLTGEFEPSKGKVWKHPDMRFAYVAQHAFHHIEQHLNKTPNEYIQWRYSSGEDKEALVKSTAVITKEEEKIMERPIEVKTVDADGNTKKNKWVIKRLVSRRKERKTYKYEVSFVGRSQDDNQYYTAASLEKFGWGKKVKELDRRLVALEGLRHRPLTTANVEKHLAAVGLDSEFATHNRIRDLSGGQKVKVVLGACTWCQPHLIILDEPTNYLDRDSLGALAGAIRDFAGGIVLITHNQEFADATTKVTWVVANNRVTVNGDPEWEKYAAEAAAIMDDNEEEVDSHGNTIKKVHKAKPVEELTAKEVKKYKKQIRKKIKGKQPLEDWEELYAIQWDISI